MKIVQIVKFLGLVCVTFLGISLLGAHLSPNSGLGGIAFGQFEYVYVVNSNVHHVHMPDWATVAKLRGSNLEILGTATVGQGAHSVAVSVDRTRVWVTCPPANSITVIDAASLSILRTIDFGDTLHRPVGIAFTPDGSRAYVTFESLGSVGVFDAETYELLSTVSVGGDPTYIIFTPDGRKAYVVNMQDPQVAAIRTLDNTIVRTLDFGGNALQDAVVSPDGSMVYVCNLALNQIEVIRTSDDTALAPIPTTPLVRPRGIGISPDGAYLFVGFRDQLWDEERGEIEERGVVNMLRLSDNTVVSTVEIPANARRLVVRPDGSRIFVAEHDYDECYAFDVDGESLTFAAVADLNTVPGLAASPVGLAIRGSPFPGFEYDPCRLFPGRCRLIDPDNLFPGFMYIGPLDEFGERLVDPLPYNCMVKFPCPGCGDGKLCNWYNFIFDFSEVNLAPDVLTIELFNFKGELVADETIVEGTKVLSFRPQRFRQGGVGEELFFSFQLGPKGKPGKRYKIPVRLEITEQQTLDASPVRDFSASVFAKVNPLCQAQASHELDVSWQVAGKGLPDEVIIEITGPDGKTTVHREKTLQGTRSFKLLYPGGGMVAVEIRIDESYGTTGPPMARVWLPACK